MIPVSCMPAIAACNALGGGAWFYPTITWKIGASTLRASALSAASLPIPHQQTGRTWRLIDKLRIKMAGIDEGVVQVRADDEDEFTEGELQTNWVWSAVR